MNGTYPTSMFNMRDHGKIVRNAPTSEMGMPGEHLGLKSGLNTVAERRQSGDTTMSQLQRWLTARENEHLEFKEARNNFHFEKLVKYCAALANEGGGSIVLGVGDKRPRRIVGSQAFADVERTKAGLLEKLRLRVEIQEVAHPEGRVLVITAPSRPLGVPIAVDGAYWMRAGEDLAPMTPDVLRRIFNESSPDFSAEICKGATLDDLDPDAVHQFRVRWHGSSSNDHLLRLSSKQLLSDAGLVIGSGVTYAALILLGTRTALARYLAQSETIFEYRSTEAPGPANQREEFRQGFLLFHDRLWNLVNLRNDLQHYQDGFVMHSVTTFNEVSVREGVLNAVAHRDYREPGSIFVRQYGRRTEIVSPGGFPSGVSPENILDKQFPRNRRVAESLLRCGLVERAGQGVNRILIEAVTDSKPLPDYSRSDEYEVFLRMRGDVEDGAFVKFLTHLPAKQKAAFLSHHYLVLDLIRRNQRIPGSCRDELELLRTIDIVRAEGRGRGVRYFIDAALYEPSTRADRISRTQDRRASKRHLLTHIEEMRGEGCTLAELHDLFPYLSREQVRTLLKELQVEGRIRVAGRTKNGRWFPVDEAGVLAAPKPNPDRIDI